MRVAILACKDLTWNTRVVRQAMALAAAGHEVTVVDLRPPGAELIARTPTVSYLSVWLASWPWRTFRGRRGGVAATSGSGVVAALPGPLFRNLALPLIHLDRPFAFASAARAALAGRRFDVVQAHDSYALPAARAIARTSDAKLVYDAVEIPEHRTARPHRFTALTRLAERRYERRAVAEAAAVMTVSAGLADWLAAFYRIARPEVIHNCRCAVAPTGDQAIRRDLGLGADDRLVLCLNTVRQGQGVETLVEAAAQLAPNVHVATLGPFAEPAFEVALRARIAGAGLGERFHILAPKPPGEVVGYAAGADIGVIPTPNVSLNLWFGLPNRVFELIMARLPIAASRLGDTRALIEANDLGVMFDETDAGDMARAITRLLGEAEARRPALDDAAARFCWEREGERYRQLIEQA